MSEGTGGELEDRRADITHSNAWLMFSAYARKDIGTWIPHGAKGAESLAFSSL